jgi:HSP20 family molecular chaperone IbpA
VIPNPVVAMARDAARDWMWSEACEMIARAERMHRELFRPAGPQARSLPGSVAWEPPVDILETEHEILVLVALPGVDVDGAQVVIEDGDLVIAGTRVLPPELRTATIHRLELPQGQFFRRLRLPAGRYSAVRRAVSAGCLVITLQKAGANRG